MNKATRGGAASLTMFVAGLAACACAALSGAAHAEHADVRLAASDWQVSGHVTFVKQEGFPDGIMRLTDEDGSEAVLRHTRFDTGSIEFDVKLLGDGIPGIQFRRRGPGTSDMFYLRPDDDCRAANDCIQYVPIVHGVMPWNMYPEYQSAAPMLPKDWNHFRLVVSAHRMDVYVNRGSEPTLVVGRLEGDAPDGELALVGPAAFANLTIRAGETGRLPAEAAPDPTAPDPNYVRVWQASPPSPLAYGQAPGFAQAQAVTRWTNVPIEAHGLVNLSRF